MTLTKYYFLFLCLFVVWIAGCEDDGWDRETQWAYQQATLQSGSVNSSGEREPMYGWSRPEPDGVLTHWTAARDENNECLPYGNVPMKVAPESLAWSPWEEPGNIYPFEDEPPFDFPDEIRTRKSGFAFLGVSHTPPVPWDGPYRYRYHYDFRVAPPAGGREYASGCFLQYSCLNQPRDYFYWNPETMERGIYFGSWSPCRDGCIPFPDYPYSGPPQVAAATSSDDTPFDISTVPYEEQDPNWIIPWMGKSIGHYRSVYQSIWEGTYTPPPGATANPNPPVDLWPFLYPEGHPPMPPYSAGAQRMNKIAQSAYRLSLTPTTGNDYRNVGLSEAERSFLRTPIPDLPDSGFRAAAMEIMRAACNKDAEGLFIPGYTGIECAPYPTEIASDEIMIEYASVYYGSLRVVSKPCDISGLTIGGLFRCCGALGTPETLNDPNFVADPNVWTEIEWTVKANSPDGTRHVLHSTFFTPVEPNGFDPHWITIDDGFKILVAPVDQTVGFKVNWESPKTLESLLPLWLKEENIDPFDLNHDRRLNLKDIELGYSF